MKTEIPDVAALLKLRVLRVWMLQNGLDEAAALIDIWINNFLIDMVSNERKSRKEIIDALIAKSNIENPSFGDKLMGSPK